MTKVIEIARQYKMEKVMLTVLKGELFSPLSVTFSMELVLFLQLTKGPVGSILPWGTIHSDPDS